MTKTFDVCIPITGHAWITVEAESESEAIDKALMSEELSLGSINEWEAHRSVCRGNVFSGSVNDAYAVEQ